MPTYEDKNIVDQIIQRDGYYPGDPRAFQVSSYVNQYGKTCYHIAYSEKELARMLESPHVSQVKILWKRN
jgi:hypothetical protein